MSESHGLSKRSQTLGVRDPIYKLFRVVCEKSRLPAFAAPDRITILEHLHFFDRVNIYFARLCHLQQRVKTAW